MQQLGHIFYMLHTRTAEQPFLSPVSLHLQIRHESWESPRQGCSCHSHFIPVPVHAKSTGRKVSVQMCMEGSSLEPCTRPKGRKGQHKHRTVCVSETAPRRREKQQHRAGCAKYRLQQVVQELAVISATSLSKPDGNADCTALKQQKAS